MRRMGKSQANMLGFLGGVLLPLLLLGLEPVSRLPIYLHRYPLSPQAWSLIGGWKPYLYLGLLGLILVVIAYRQGSQSSLVAEGFLLGGGIIGLLGVFGVAVEAWRGMIGGDRWFALPMAARGLWLPLSPLLLGAMPTAALLYYLSMLRRKTQAYRHPRSRGCEAGLLLAFLLALLSILIPHASFTNPRSMVVFTDTIFNARWMRILDQEGLIGGIVNLAHALRPLYLAFLYTLHKAIHVSPEILADNYLPLLGLLLLAATVYLLEYLGGGRPGLASVLSILYWSPMFIYGGFQTNLYSLSIAMTYAYTLWREKWGASLIVGVLLGLWHPWTLAYYTVASIPLLAYKLYYEHASWRLPLALLIIPWIAVAVVNYPLLRAAGPLAASIARPATPGGNPLFTLLVYVWGTAARPEIILPAALLLTLSPENNWAYWYAVPALIAFPLLNPTGAYRILMQAPLPLLAARYARSRIAVYGILLAATGSWIYLVATAPPIKPT